MRIGVLRVYFRIHNSRSLKQKRAVVRSLKDRLYNKFNVSVAEIGANDVWQAGELGIATVGNDQQFVDSVTQKVKNFIEFFPGISVIEFDIEIL
jgi:uncharacterized protein YlxP (DUF503 family)